MEDRSHAVQTDTVQAAASGLPHSIIPAAVNPPALIEIHAAHQALATRIRRAVRRHTNRAVDELRVEVDQHSVRLFGHCPSFYCKQLAQQAAMRMTAGVPLVNDITVAE